MRRRGLRSIVACLGSVSLWALAGATLAQTVPPQVMPGGQPPTKEEVKPELPSVGNKATVNGKQAFTSAPCALDSSALNVTINSVAFKAPGNTDVPPQIAAILKDVGPGVTGEQPIRNVCAIRDRANYALRKAGYIASVQIVPQDMSSGELQLIVVTAHIVEVRVHGDAGAYRKLMDQRIAELQALNPLNEHDAERILLLTSDVPGLDVRLSLRSAGTTPGAVIGDLTISTLPYKVMASVNNYGSRQVGPETAYVRAEFYGLTVDFH